MALIELFVENLAVIESARLTLGSGFTVLTGETGAGKSLVVDAMALALGARAASDQVRTGADAARVEAVFDGVEVATDDPLADVVALGDGQAIVRREIGADGRSVARLNDRSVTIGALASLGGRLAEIHGQHEQQRLLAPDRQLELLDRFGDLAARVVEVAALHRAWRGAVAASAELLVDGADLERQVDLLRHQLDEIHAAELRPGEDEEVERDLRAGTHAEAVVRSASEAVAALTEEGAGVDALRTALAALQRASADDERFADAADRAATMVAEASELARDVERAAHAVDLDPAHRARLEERLTLLHDLRRKYGPTLDEVITAGERASEDLERLADQEGLRARLRADEVRSRSALEAAAAQLRAARSQAALQLGERVNAELPALGLRGGAFGVELEAADLGPRGADRVTFTFAPNPGEPARPLGRIASGGEASRLSLALKVVLAAADETPLLIFDEVDAGIGGRHATALGERLRALSAYHQVICVTHLAQVAAFAGAHIHVGKQVVDGRTVATVTRLDGDGRAAELAAMLTGEAAGSEALAAAEALLRAAVE